MRCARTRVMGETPTLEALSVWLCVQVFFDAHGVAPSKYGFSFD
jgi:hypothetical protein